MAKLDSSTKAHYNTLVSLYGTDSFIYSRELGISIFAHFTGEMKKHIRIVVAHCGPKDTFKKKIGYIECIYKLEKGEGVIMPTSMADNNLFNNLCRFVNNNFPETNWERL